MAETKDKNEDKKVFPGEKLTEDGTTIVRTIGRDFRVEGNDVDGYVGVSPEYRTYANETEKPYTTAEDVELFEATGTLTDVEMMTLQNAAQSQRAEDADSDDEDSDDDKDKDDKGGDDKPTAGETGVKQGQGKAPAAPAKAAAASTK